MARSFDLIATVLITALAMPQVGAAGGLWSPSCVPYGDQECPNFFASFVPWNGRVSVTIGTACDAGTLRLHRWGQNDAAYDLVQWTNADGVGVTPEATGVCIEVGPATSEIQVSPAGGSCAGDTPYTAAPPPAGAFAVTDQDDTSFYFTGCQASFHYESPQYLTIAPKNVTASFGGVLMQFSDGYRWGDSFNAGYLYSVFDGSLYSGPFGVPWSEFATKYSYTYDVFINSQIIPIPSNN